MITGTSYSHTLTLNSHSKAPFLFKVRTFMDKRWNVFQQDKQSPVTGDSFIITIILIVMTAAWHTSAKRSRSSVVLFFLLLIYIQWLSASWADALKLKWPLRATGCQRWRRSGICVFHLNSIQQNAEHGEHRQKLLPPSCNFWVNEGAWHFWKSISITSIYCKCKCECIDNR